MQGIDQNTPLSPQQHSLVVEHYYLCELEVKVHCKGWQSRWDDMLSVAAFALVNCARHYQESKGTFLTYASTGIKFELWAEQRRLRKQRLQEGASLDEPLPGVEQTLADLVADRNAVEGSPQLEAAEQLSRALAWCRLRPKDVNLLLRHYGIGGNRKRSTVPGRSKDAYKNRLKHLIKKCRNRLEDYRSGLETVVV